MQALIYLQHKMHHLKNDRRTQIFIDKNLCCSISDKTSIYKKLFEIKFALSTYNLSNGYQYHYGFP